MRARLYSRPGCHLCEEMKGVVARASRATGVLVEIEEVDISADADLEAQYGQEIPVLEVDGRRVAKYRISVDDAQRLLRARQAGNAAETPTGRAGGPTPDDAN